MQKARRDTGEPEFDTSPHFYFSLGEVKSALLPLLRRLSRDCVLTSHYDNKVKEKIQIFWNIQLVFITVQQNCQYLS